MATITTTWHSTEPLPDEAHLKALWQAEVDSRERALAAEEAHSARWNASLLPLMTAAGLSEADIEKKVEEAAALSRTAFGEAEAQLGTPPIDVEALGQQELEIVEANAALAMEGLPPGVPEWSDTIRTAISGGCQRWWEGEEEEEPFCSVNVGARRIDSKVQAYGEGCSDSDFSACEGYLNFRFTPPSWGHLIISVRFLASGSGFVYSDRGWPYDAYAGVLVLSKVDVHQGFWRGWEGRLLFDVGGPEINPGQSGWIIRRFTQDYHLDVVEGQPVTIRAGMAISCSARSAAGCAGLDFATGSSRYIGVPYVHWHLAH